MNILVLVRPVPAAEARLRVNPEGDGYDLASLKLQVNEFDLFAMEEALRIKERFEKTEITGVMVGPARALETLKKALALGADHGALIDDSQAPAADALATASLIAAWARPRRFDLILCGVMSEDLQRSQVGPMLAELLAVRCATTAVSLQLQPDQGRLLCERELEGGAREKLELPLPALVSVQSGINLPRYASLSHVLRVKEMAVPVIAAAELGPVLSNERTVRAYFPTAAGVCEFLEGDLEAMAETLVEKIRQRVPVI